MSKVVAVSIAIAMCFGGSLFASEEPVPKPANEAEVQQHELGRLVEIGKGIAELTKMNFFSSEVAQVESGEFVLIDYVNDQCHMLSQSSAPKMGVPDAVVAGIARKLVDAAAELAGKPRPDTAQQVLAL